MIIRKVRSRTGGHPLDETSWNVGNLSARSILMPGHDIRCVSCRFGLEVGIFPGHACLHPPGRKFTEVLGYNIRVQLADRDSFAASRLRKGQTQSKLLDSG